MIPVSDLAILSDVARSRVNRLIALWNEGFNYTPEDLRRIAYITIELDACWASFSREFFLSCAALYAKSSSGAAFSSNLKVSKGDYHAALHKAIQIQSPRSKAAISGKFTQANEPRWNDKQTLISIASAAQFSNHSSIMNAFSIITSYETALRPVRNFMAHKNRDTMLKAVSAMNLVQDVPAGHSLYDSLCFTYGTAREPYLQAWLFEVRDTIEFMCQ